MKVEIVEYVEERFDVDVEDGLTGDALANAVELARIVYDGRRDIAVTDVKWEDA